LAQALWRVAAGPKMADFKKLAIESHTEIAQLRQEVMEFAMQFPTIGFEKATMRYSE
jgi:hypothetical protein